MMHKAARSTCDTSDNMNRKIMLSLLFSSLQEVCFRYLCSCFFCDMTRVLYKDDTNATIRYQTKCVFV